MMGEDLVIVFDIDGTICNKKKKGERYSDLLPNTDVVARMRYYKEELDAYIVLYTSRQMRTFQNNIGKINAVTAKELYRWLDRYEIPYDEIYFGKPWCGFTGFYVDDKAIRPEEFLNNSYEDIVSMLRGGSQIA